jgi:2-dehydropantoate 2-reductase
VSAAVAVLGPGAVGGALAVPLTKAGTDVVVVARQRADSAELVLERPGETVRAPLCAVDRLEVPVDLLLVTVKAPALADALDRVEAAPAAVLPLLNGLEHVEPIRARFGRRVAAGSIGRFEAYRVSPTRIVQRTPSGLVSIASDDLTGEDLERVAVIIRPAGVEVRLRESEKAVLWEKAARLAPLAAITTATHRPLGELRSHPELAAAIEEACAVATADGVPTTPADQWAIIDSMADSLTTSTARDVAAGRPSELDAIAGAVVRAGDRLGVPTPALDDLLDRCRA